MLQVTDTAMVWGAAGGIGRALIQELQRRQWRTIGIARDAVTLDTPASNTFTADFGNREQVEEAVRLAAMETESVDLWIYAAGDILATTVAEGCLASWQRILDANLTGAFIATHFSLPLLAPNAHLMYIGAAQERLRLPGLSAYAAAKAGLEAFAEALGKEEGTRRVTVVRPGAVDTPLWQKVPMRLPAGAATPQEVAIRLLDAHAAGHSGRLDL